MFSVINGKEKSSLNLFTDEFGRHLPSALIQSSSKRVENIVLLCYHYSPEVYKQNLQVDSNRYSYYNGFDDPLNWFTNSTGASLKRFEDVTGLIDSLRHDTSLHTIVVIDDLRMFLRSSGHINNHGEACAVSQFLNKLAKRYQLYMFIKASLVSEHLMKDLHHICNLNVQFTLKKKTNATTNEMFYQCAFTLKKKSGKVIAECQDIKIESNNHMVVCSKINSKTKMMTSADVAPANEVDPTSNLTFNLRLTSNEKEARAKTVLPYILNDESKAEFLNTVSTSDTASSGNVIYEPDDADDFDDEDPDDDLDV